MSLAPIAVEHGKILGSVVTNPTGNFFYSFRGIPYAKPPIGLLRFKDPQPLEEWSSIFDATTEKNACFHSEVDYFGNKEYLGDEDCLYLNVYSSKLDESASLPVMMFINGENFTFGSANTDLHGPDYLVEKDVVVVTINYRGGVFGFLSLNNAEVPGNAGMKDIVAAIKWVKNNIKQFGGDAQNLTVFGQGAGGAAVSYLTVSPLTKKLISKAIIQSGNAMNFWAIQKNPELLSETLAKRLGCKSLAPDEILTFLRGCSATELLKASEELSPKDEFNNKFNSFVPVIEEPLSGVEAFIVEPFSDLLRSGRIADIPTMIGTCTLDYYSDKMSQDLQVFIPEEIKVAKDSKESVLIAEKLKQLYFRGNDGEDLYGYFDLASDRAVRVDTRQYIQFLAELEKRPIYVYNFDYFGALNVHRKINDLEFKYAMHTDELGYIFRNNFQKDVVHTHEDIEMREKILRLWTNFAKSGNPTPEKDFYLTVTWPPATKDNLQYLNLGTQLSVKTDVNQEKMAFWRDIYNKDLRAKIVNSVVITPEKTSDGNENDLPKNVGVNRFVSYFESLKK